MTVAAPYRTTNMRRYQMLLTRLIASPRFRRLSVQGSYGKVLLERKWSIKTCHLLHPQY